MIFVLASFAGDPYYDDLELMSLSSVGFFLLLTTLKFKNCVQRMGKIEDMHSTELTKLDLLGICNLFTSCLLFRIVAIACEYTTVL